MEAFQINGDTATHNTLSHIEAPFCTSYSLDLLCSSHAPRLAGACGRTFAKMIRRVNLFDGAFMIPDPRCMCPLFSLHCLILQLVFEPLQGATHVVPPLITPAHGADARDHVAVTIRMVFGCHGTNSA